MLRCGFPTSPFTANSPDPCRRSRTRRRRASRPGRAAVRRQRHGRFEIQQDQPRGRGASASTVASVASAAASSVVSAVASSPAGSAVASFATSVPAASTTSEVSTAASVATFSPRRRRGRRAAAAAAGASGNRCVVQLHRGPPRVPVYGERAIGPKPGWLTRRSQRYTPAGFARGTVVTLPLAPSVAPAGRLSAAGPRAGWRRRACPCSHMRRPCSSPRP